MGCVPGKKKFVDGKEEMVEWVSGEILLRTHQGGMRLRQWANSRPELVTTTVKREARVKKIKLQP